mgnify:FL=1
MIKITTEKARGVIEFVASREEEIKDLPKNVAHGSTCFVIATSTVYMFDEEDKTWKAI